MRIRMYRKEDCKEVTELFYHTVHTVNAKDYTEEQLNVWAGKTVDLKQWDQSLQEHYSVVAVEEEKIVGFGDIDAVAGYLDRLYVHARYQRQGIASAICEQLEKQAQGTITTHASITAKPFFEKRGYHVVRAQEVERKGILLKNFVMEK
ncbi:MAG: GNAT family N-acetyltransferase [Eubacteriales bacterium]|nr:GNAT family N-acetyltransferase [Eubacteriales bacterium]